MTNYEIELTLPQQDSYLVEIEKQIQSKRNFLLQRRRQLNDASRENTFLNAVKEDYQKYQSYIMKQKEEQIQSMQILDQYLNDLIISGKLTTHDISQTKNDQKEVILEINKIKGELDHLMK